MSATIRRARPSDAGDIARLTIQLGYDLAEAAAAERLSRILSRADQQFLVAEREGRCVGWIHATLVEAFEAGAFVQIAGLVVDRAHRGLGIGARLMHEAETWALRQGCPVVRLWSTAAREAAHKFYEALGYQQIKTQYSFVKLLEPGAGRDVSRFIPRVDV